MMLLQIAVAWSATCGTLTPLTDSTARYTAPITAPTGGRCLAIATRSDGARDTTVVSLAAADVVLGLPLGPYELDAADATSRAVFTMGHNPVGPATILAELADARAQRHCLILAMTAGHLPYLTNGVFDRAKWDARMQTFNSGTIRAAVAEGVAGGWVCGANVMDEPQVSGLGDGNTWGPKGTMTKLRVDSLCGWVKAIFPTLPAGVAHRHDAFEPTKGYRVCDFLIDQYTSMAGGITAFRDTGLAMAARDGIAWLPSLNIINGGLQDRDGTWSCDGAGQAGVGTYSPNCRMTPTQVTDWGGTLGRAGCGLLMWRFAADYMALPANVAAFRGLASTLSALPRHACRRS